MRTRCKKGFRKNKDGDCQQKDTFKRRCKNGTRKHPKSNNCEKYPFVKVDRQPPSKDAKLKLLRQEVEDLEREVHQMLNS
jgi:hypothetical protein